ncbi:hypothetical protein AB0I66_02000 [Streptomyces sp. NPDC050439]|uniref:hypothetical protein n=1 Tax=unclassified Streptomyces TaxID=2593676 RepID=UPI003415A3A2
MDAAHIPEEKGAPDSAAPADAEIAVRAFAVRTSDGGGTRGFIDRLITGRADVPAVPALAATEAGDVASRPGLTGAAGLLVAVVQEAVAALPVLPARSSVVLCGGSEPGPGRAAAKAAAEKAAAEIRTVLASASMSVSATVRTEAVADVEALHGALRALRSGQVDVAVVAGASSGLGSAAADGREGMCSAAVAVVLTRHTLGSQGTDEPLALIDRADIAAGEPDVERDSVVFPAHRPGSDDTAALCGQDDDMAWEGPLGRGSGVAGLEAVAAAATSVHHGVRPRSDAHAEPWLAPRRTARVLVTGNGGGTSLRLRSVRETAAAWAPRRAAAQHLYVFSGTDAAQVLDALERGHTSRSGPARLVIVAAGQEAYHRRVQQARDWLAEGGRRPRPPGVYFSARPLGGDLAFVFPNGAAAYSGMARTQLLAFPRAIEELRHRGDPREMAGWAYAPSDGPADAVGKIYAASFLSMVHTHITTGVLGLRPQAVLGYSSGEISALLATGVWQDVAGLLADTRSSPLFSGLLTHPWRAIRAGWQRAEVPGSQWAAHLVGTDPRHAAEAVKDEPGVHLLTVNAPSSCTLGGEAEACRRVLERLPHEYAVPLDYDIAVHTPMARTAAAQWRDYFRRPVRPADDGLRFYTCSGTYRFTPRPDAIAEASVAQALGTIDFVGAVEQAWADGVRVFVEHGPKERCTQWIREILGERPHLALALDPTDGRGLDRLTELCAQLVAAGVEADDEALFAHLSAARGVQPHEVRLPHQPEPVVIPTPAVMEPAPVLPPLDLDCTRGDTAGLRATVVKGTISSASATGTDAYAQVAATHCQLMDQHQRMQALLLRGHHHFSEYAVAPAGRAPSRDEPPVLEASGHVCLAATLHSALAQRVSNAALSTRPPRAIHPSLVELVFHGPLPRPDETLHHQRNAPPTPFEHTVHASGRPVLTLRAASDSAQASLRTVPESVRPTGAGPARGFDPEAVRAFREGRPYDCFGSAWAVTRSHIRTPRSGTDELAILHRVTSFDPHGGAHGLGHLTAQLRPCETHLYADTAPTTPSGEPLAETDSLPFLLEGSQQALAFHLAALGLTKERDGWRFQPLAGSPCTLFHTPSGTSGGVVACEVTITEIATDAHEPYLRADLVCSRDRAPVLRARNMTLQLVQDWPLEQWRRLAAGHGHGHGQGQGQHALRHIPSAAFSSVQTSAPDPRALVRDGLRLDRGSMVAAAWGRPSEALGAAHRSLDAQPRVIRLPAPPYQCLTRVTHLKATPWEPEEDSCIEAEYDIPEAVSGQGDGIFRRRDGESPLPPALLLEAALQPCGWLAQYVGAAQDLPGTPVFRNLDGETRYAAPIPPQARVLTTRATLRRRVDDGTMVLVFFDVECWADSVTVFSGTTSFGFFPPDAFAQRTGLPGPPPHVREEGAEPVLDCDLTARPGRWFDGPVRLPRTPLLMLDELAGHWPEGGHAGRGRLRARKRVDAGDWYFTAHFFQDPVQPGSLGIEAMYQLLRCHLIALRLDAGMPSPHIEPTTTSAPLTWKYRGQVVPTDTLVTVDVDITGLRHGPDGIVLTGDGWLSVDGTCIYHATGLALRLTEGTTAERKPRT